MEREKRLSILYQKQGRATQFANKAARDKWLQKEIDEYKRALSTNLAQVKLLFFFVFFICINSSVYVWKTLCCEPGLGVLVGPFCYRVSSENVIIEYSLEACQLAFI